MRQPVGEISGPRNVVTVQAALKALYDDAALAQKVMNRIGAFLAQRFDAKFSARPTPKDQERVIDKCDQRYHGDYSYASDLACIMLQLKQGQIKNALDQFCGDNAESRAMRAELKRLGVIVMDPTENRISYPDSNGLRNLATNLAVEITRPDGTKTYHVCEIQCVHEKAVPLYKLSHDHFEQMREAKTAMRKAEARVLRYRDAQMEAAKATDVNFHTLQMMERRIEAANEEIAFHKKIYEKYKILRLEANLEATRITGKPGIDAFLGYQPRNDNMTENLATQGPKEVQSRQLAVHPT
jgi:hypothetical protein